MFETGDEQRPCVERAGVEADDSRTPLSGVEDEGERDPLIPSPPARLGTKIGSPAYTFGPKS